MEADKPRQFLQLLAKGQETPSTPSSFWKLMAARDAPERQLRKRVDEEQSISALHFDPDAVFWAMRNLPAKEALKHFVICGVTGAGKTIAIQLFLQSIAPRFKPDAKMPEQLIVFDGKCDILPLLGSMELRPEQNNFWLLNPFDQRSAVWNVADAVQSPAMARAFATLIVPEEKQSNARYFSDAARELLYAAIVVLNHVAGTDWTLRDLICAFESPARLAAVTAQHPRARSIAEQHLNDDKHAASVFSTLGTKLGPFEQVAALWHTNPTGRRFSIQKFLEEPGVLVLGNDPVLRDSFWPINATLLKALTHEILRRPNTLKPRHWFVLDEFKAMERVDCIHLLLDRGRSKGASVLLGLQSLEGLVEIYGEHVANNIMSQCAHKAFLRTGGPYTAEWAERCFGKVRRIEETSTTNWGSNGSSNSEHRSLQERSLFLPSVFMDLPFPDARQPYTAICDVPHLRRTLIVRRRFDTLLAWCGKIRDEDTAEAGIDEVPSAMYRTDIKDQILRPWTSDEERLFCGPLPVASTEEEPPAPEPKKTKPKLPRGYGL